MTARDSLRQVLDSQPHRDWAARHAVDARKVELEFNGQHRPSPASAYARGLVGLCRAHPPVAAPPSTPATLLAQPGALLRTPGGNVEDMARFKAAGGRWVACNVGDHPASEWQTVKSRAAAAGVKFGYWQRCRAPQDITRLLTLSAGTDLALVNVEQPEIEDGTLPPGTVAATIRLGATVPNIGTLLQGWLGWVDDQGVHHGPDYRPLAPWPALLEVFPTDMRTLPAGLWEGCRDHALALGLSTVLQLVQTYGAAQPAWYTPPYALYTLDDCSDEIERWLQPPTGGGA